MKPLVELKNFGSSTHVVICGLDISMGVYGVKYWIKKEQRSTFVKKKPVLRLDIDLVEFVKCLEKFSDEDIQSALEILKLYFRDKELLKQWRSQL